MKYNFKFCHKISLTTAQTNRLASHQTIHWKWIPDNHHHNLRLFAQKDDSRRTLRRTGWPLARGQTERGARPEPAKDQAAWPSLQHHADLHQQIPTHLPRKSTASQTKLIAVREKIRNGNSDIEFSSTQLKGGADPKLHYRGRLFVWWWRLVLPNWPRWLRWQHWPATVLWRLCIAQFCTDLPTFFLEANPNSTYTPNCSVCHKWASISLDGFFLFLFWNEIPFVYTQQRLCLFERQEKQIDF